MEDKGSCVVTLRVDALKYNKDNGQYTITLNDDVNNIEFVIKDASKIIKIDDGPFISNDAGSSIEKAEMKQSAESIFTRRDKWFLFLWFVYIVAAILVFMVIEGDDFFTSFYFRIVTSFGVGYGDYYPMTATGKILNCIFIVIDFGKIYYINWRIISILFHFKQQKYAFDASSIGTISTPHPRIEKDKLNESKCSRIVNDQRLFLHYVLVLLGIFFMCGTFVMIFVEDYHWLDAIHWNFVTLSQVGYGDVIPTSTAGQIFTIFYIVLGYVLLVLLAVFCFDNYMAKIMIKKNTKNAGSDAMEDNGVELTGLLSQ